MSVRVRFAPSPTGFLHLGNLRTALFNWLFARKQGGVFILRIEDTDAARSERRFEEQLLQDLRWMGLDWDESVDVGGDFGPYRQSERYSIYQGQAQRLLEQGHAYYCFCSDSELEEDRRRIQAGQEPLFIGRDRDLPMDEARKRLDGGEEAAVRFKVRDGQTGFKDLVFGPVSVDCRTIADFVLLRSDRSPQYNFAAAVDDSLMQISHVIRGDGHISNTHKQVLLYEALGLEPPRIAHLSTILGPDGAKLSKRHGSSSLGELRDLGYLPQALTNYLALLGWAPEEEGREIFSPSQLVEAFDLERVNRSAATFDQEKLNWVNRSHLKQLEPEELARRALPYFQQAGRLPQDAGQPILQWLAQLIPALLKYLDRLDQAVETSGAVFDFDPEAQLQSPDVQDVLSIPGAWEVIEALCRELRQQAELNLDSYKQAVSAVKASTGRKGKALFQPIRVALTARTSGLELDKLVPILETGRLLDLPAPVIGVRQRVEEVLGRRPQ